MTKGSHANGSAGMEGIIVVTTDRQLTPKKAPRSELTNPRLPPPKRSHGRYKQVRELLCRPTSTLIRASR